LRQTLQTVLDTLRNDLQGLGDNLTQQLKNLNTTVTQTADRVLEAIGTAQMSATSLSSLFNEADAAGSQVTLKEVDFAVRCLLSHPR
jgi:ABC-type transporter Mla subunit MlaD